MYLLEQRFARGPVHTCVRVHIECLRVCEKVEWLENLPKNLLLVSVDRGRPWSNKRDSREVSGKCEASQKVLKSGPRVGSYGRYCKRNALSFRSHGRGGTRCLPTLYIFHIVTLLNLNDVDYINIENNYGPGEFFK